MSDLQDVLEEMNLEIETELKKLLQRVMRRGEERGWNAARKWMSGTPTYVKDQRAMSTLYNAIDDWRSSEEYKEGK